MKFYEFNHLRRTGLIVIECDESTFGNVREAMRARAVTPHLERVSQSEGQCRYVALLDNADLATLEVLLEERGCKFDSAEKEEKLRCR